mmetsp:Transcript_35620/g.65499  ORF Transcript_35620/g.65499 Transcript_35620/m.65499 type:complete len:234 (-) Transcript_35620:129-830(-)
MICLKGKLVPLLLTAVATPQTTAFHAALQHDLNGRMANTRSPMASATPLFAVDQRQREQQQEMDQETIVILTDERDSHVDIDRLKAVAQKYRAEAAALEAQRAQERAARTEKAFAAFDRNKDGVISLSELRDVLEDQLGTKVPQERVEALMRRLDRSGDGKLQPDEFVGTEQCKAMLAGLARDEWRRAVKLKKIALIEKQVYSKFAKILKDKHIIDDERPKYRRCDNDGNSLF